MCQLSRFSFAKLSLNLVNIPHNDLEDYQQSEVLFARPDSQSDSDPDSNSDSDSDLDEVLQLVADLEKGDDDISINYLDLPSDSEIESLQSENFSSETVNSLTPTLAILRGEVVELTPNGPTTGIDINPRLQRSTMEFERYKHLYFELEFTPSKFEELQYANHEYAFISVSRNKSFTWQFKKAHLMELMSYYLSTQVSAFRKDLVEHGLIWKIDVLRLKQDPRHPFLRGMFMLAWKKGITLKELAEAVLRHLYGEHAMRLSIDDLCFISPDGEVFEEVYGL